MTPFQSFDGTMLFVHTLGDAGARPIVLLHGLFSNAKTNWVKYGAAAEIAAAGFRLILPDFRAHGASDKPQDPARYPADVLAQDIEALIAHLGLSDYDLGGYSLGARTTIRLLARGQIPAPRKVVLGGMGLAGITGGTERASFFLRVIESTETFPAGTAEFAAQAFMRQNNIDGPAVANLLRSQVSTPLEVVRTLQPQSLVIAGVHDQDNGNAEELALALPHAAHVAVTGNHMSAVTKPDFGAAIAGWLVH
jgi:pimeloyl-ACP methyl ester carboxylesterase